MRSSIFQRRMCCGSRAEPFDLPAYPSEPSRSVHGTICFTCGSFLLVQGIGGEAGVDFVGIGGAD